MSEPPYHSGKRAWQAQLAAMTASCLYCQDYRSPCICTEDCGKRTQGRLDHVCQKAPAEVRAEAMRQTGLYSEEEIARLAKEDQ